MKTILFKDPLNGCTWFLLNGILYCAPAFDSDNDICPAEVHSPDAAPQYMKDFVICLLGDEDQHKNYTNTFYELDSEHLNKAIDENFNGHLTMIPR